MKLSKIFSSFIGASILLGGIPFIAVCADTEPEEVFYDDFSGNSLDTDKWLIAYKNWGGKVTVNGVKQDYNGGVIPQNIAVKNGKLVLEGHGNLYEGDILGINRNMTFREDGKRVGAAVATKEYFASGSYEIRAKVAPELGACSAMWTFEYEEDWDTGAITNHEIDIEMPGRPASKAKDQSFRYALCNTWTGENDGEYLTGYTDIGSDQADGEFHKYRFDWHTGDEGEEPRVEFYFDDVLTYTSRKHIPVNEGRLWLGLWFPREWAGTPDFDTSAFEIDYVKITPFHEKGDRPQNETYPDDGWGDPSMLRPSAVTGDVNGDGEFSTADIVALNWYLLGRDTELDTDPADLINDGKIDAFDLCEMRKRLISQGN